MPNEKNYSLAVIAIVLLTILGLRLFWLQLAMGGKYREEASVNAAKIVPSPAARGIIYDRNGKVMVENRPIFSVQVLPQLLSSRDKNKRARVLNRLGEILGEKIRFKPSSDRPIIVKDNIALETAMKIEEEKRELDGVIVSIQPVRFYPHGKTASLSLGYVGEIEQDELKRQKSEGYKLGDWVGKDGVEKVYDNFIRGVDGGKMIEVDVYGSPTRMLETVEPKPGADVKLTIDLDLQIAAEKALGEKEGAVVVLDPKTGEILALVSRPSFDPNDVKLALGHGRHPFMNRALAVYPPGSIFKVVTLTAALDENLTQSNEAFYCPGYYNLNGRIAKCWKEGGHGKITAQEGLTQSCDIVFYELGRRLGPDRLAKYAKLYGLNERTGIDLPQEKKGTIPDSEWKKRARREIWYEGDSINYGIGQGFVQVTPIQMAEIYAALASGKRMKPYIVKEIKNRNGELLYSASSIEEAKVPASPKTLAVIREALRAVVDRATGRAAKIEGFLAAGKTGTAENPGIPHAWFLCYAPYDDAKIVIASFVAHGAHGDQSSAYVARDILKWYKDNRMPTSEVVAKKENKPNIHVDKNTD
ncbi:MAG: penicillin-binding protein 2 [bacterium]